MAEPGFFFFFGRGVERWMWIETGRGERVRVEVFDFSNCQRRGGGGGGLRLGGRKG
jgi:hypothetical protein